MVDPSSALVSLDTQYRSFPALARTPPCGPRFNFLTLWEDLLGPPTTTVWLLVLQGPELFTFDFNNENVITPDVVALVYLVRNTVPLGW